MLHREQAAGAREPGLHLVRDHHDAMPVAQRADRHHEIGGRGIEAPLALHRLEHDGGDAGGVQVGLEQLVDGGKTVLGDDPMQRAGEGRVEDVGHHAAEALLVGHDLAGQRHPHEGPPVERAGEGDHRISLRGRAGDLDRVLAGLGPGGDKDRLLGEIAGGGVVQALGQADIVLIGQNLVAGMRERVQLGAHGIDHAGVAVAGVHDRDAGGEIDQAVALDVGDSGVFGMCREMVGHHAHAAGHGGAAAGGGCRVGRGVGQVLHGASLPGWMVQG